MDKNFGGNYRRFQEPNENHVLGCEISCTFAFSKIKYNQIWPQVKLLTF